MSEQCPGEGPEVQRDCRDTLPAVGASGASRSLGLVSGGVTRFLTIPAAFSSFRATGFFLLNKEIIPVGFSALKGECHTSVAVMHDLCEMG